VRTADGRRPYEVDAAFDAGGHMTVSLGQDGKWSKFWTVQTAGNPTRTGVPEQASQVVQQAMQQGMVLAVSLWEASDNMAWLNGNCNNGYPHCNLNNADLVFTNVRVIGDGPAPAPTIASPPPPSPPPSPPAPPNPPPADTCTTSTNFQCQGEDIHDAGYVRTSDECCSACLATSGCKAWTWNRGYDSQCAHPTSAPSRPRASRSFARVAHP
jgi:hypothetical protein